MFGEFKNDLDEACWKGYKQVGFKKKGDRQVPNCVPESMSIEDAKLVDGYIPESYEIGADYANHTKEAQFYHNFDIAFPCILASSCLIGGGQCNPKNLAFTAAAPATSPLRRFDALSSKAVTTLPSTISDWLIFPASRTPSPLTFDSLTRSDPAKSTKCRREACVTVAAPRVVVRVSSRVKTA